MAEGRDVLTCQFLEKVKGDEPIKSRLAVVKRVFSSYSIPMARKEETAILAVCQLAIDGNENGDILQIITCLRECLEHKRMLTYTGDFKPEVIEHLLAVFKLGSTLELDENLKASFLQLAVALLNTPYFQQWFSCDVTNLCTLLGDTFSVSSLSSSEDIAKLLASLTHVCKSTLFKSEIRLAYLEKTFVPLCHALTRIQDKSELLSKVVDSFINVVLYDPAFFEEFCMSKDEVKMEEGERPHSQRFKSILKRLIKTAPCSKDVVSLSFTIFLRSSAKTSSQRQNLEIVFDVFTTLCSLLGCKVDKKISISWIALKNWNHNNSHAIIGEMISILDDAKVPLSIDHGTYSLESWFMSLVIGTLNTNLTQLSPELLKMVEQAVNFNPLIIENCSKSIAEVMVRKKPKTCAASYVSMLTACLLGALQLQRFQKFASTLFNNLKNSIDANSQHTNFDDVVLSDVLPAVVSDCFAEAAISIPHLQMLAIFNDLLNHFQQDCLRPLESSCSDSATVLLVEIFSELLKQFLTCAKIADHSVPDNVKSRFGVLLGDLKNSLEKIGTLLVDDHDDRILKSYLDVCHSFGAVQLMVSEYEGAPIKPLSKRDLAPLNFSYVHPYLTPHQWKTIGESITDHTDCLARHSLYNLMVQKIEAVAQAEEGVDGPGAQTARQLIKIADTDWLWCEITGLAVLCEANELVQLVGSLIDSLGTCQDRWLDLIQDEKFTENRRLVLALALQLLHRAASIVAQDDDCLTKDVMDNVNMGDLLEYELSLLLTDDEDLATEIGNSLNIAKKVINDRLTTNDGDKKVFLDSSFIRVLHSLPLHHFSALSQSCVHLGVLSLLNQLPSHPEMDNLLLDIIFRIFHNPATNTGKSLVSGLDSGRILEFISARGFSFESLRYFLLTFCKESLADKKAAKKLIKAVSNPSAKTVWLTGLVVEAVQQLKVKKKMEVSGESSEEPFVLDKEKVLNTLVRLVVPILEKETPSLELMPTFSQVVNLHLKTKNDYGGVSLLNKIDEYLLICPLSPDYGMSLMETLILHRNRLGNKEIHKSIVIDGWKLILTNNQQTKLLSKVNVIFTSSTDEEFRSVTTDLSVETTGAIQSHDNAQLKILFNLWCSLVTSQISSNKNKIRQNALVTLAKDILNVLKHWKNAPNDPSIQPVFKFLSELACTTAVDIQPAVFDTILVCLQSVPLPAEDPNALLDNLAVSVDTLFGLYLFRNALILDRLHVYWPIYKTYLTGLAKISDPDTEHVTETVSCADKLERIAKTMAKRQKDFSRIAEMFIADVISVLEKHPLHPEVKLIFANIINVFLALCDDHAISYLSFSLPPASQELFKTYHHNFKKFHKYQGKI